MTVWPSLTTLLLNGVDLTSFTVLEQLLRRLPNLKSLDVAANRLQLANFSAEFSHEGLEQLNLSKNILSSWSHICRIGSKFPNLRRLLLCKNPLTSIAPRWNWRPEEHFPQLETIMLSSCYLQSWSLVEQLGDFHKLKSVYLSHTPITEFLPANIRREIVAAMLNKCMMLNGSEISSDDLVESRRVFIEFFATIRPRPRRYYELTQESVTARGFGVVPVEEQICIVIRLRNGRCAIHLDERTTASAFMLAMSRILDEPVNSIHLRLLRRSAPGKPLMKADAILSLKELGLRSGDCVIVTTQKRCN